MESKIIACIPIVGTIYQWYHNRADQREIDAASMAFQKFLQNPVASPLAAPAKKALELIERCKDNRALSREVAKLERVYFTFLRGTYRSVPEQYRVKENAEMVERFVQMGVTPEFLRYHPEFLTTARVQFWAHYFSCVKLPLWMRDGELYLPFEVAENTRHYHWKPWSQVEKLHLDDYRITYQGFAIGHPDRSRNLVPLKTVDASGKCAIQFVTSCPVGRGLPSTIDLKASGHSFTQLIIPMGHSHLAEVFSVGFYPRKIADFGIQFFKRVMGVYRNHDSNVSRIEAGQVFPIVKQYLFRDDAAASPCLLSIIRHMDVVCAALREKGYQFSPVTIGQVDQAMLDRNEPELDRILIALTKIRELIVQKKIQVNLPAMSREEKVWTMKRRFEEFQGKHSYHMLGANCTAASYREEAFVVAFLDAALDGDKAVRVYDSQVDVRDHKFGIFDLICNVIERICLHFFAAMPLTGPFLGNGLTHPDATRLASQSVVPAVLGETAFATHQMLTAPFTQRPLFPAGEILAHDAPVIPPPTCFQRIRYLWRRRSLLTPPPKNLLPH